MIFFKSFFLIIRIAILKNLNTFAQLKPKL